MQNPENVVNSMIASCCRRDIDAVMTHFHSDAIYHNIPLPAVQGHPAIRAVLAGFLEAATDVDWRIHFSVSNDAGIVMNERTDCFTLPAGKLELRVMGVFEVRDGRIAAWRDYFDMAPLAPFLGA
jgi:limonene-1,2-epoxide hydrolase